MENPKKIFWAIPKSSPRSGELQGILTKDGVLIGVDVWRSLNRHDCCSFPIEKYSSLAQALKRYDVIKIKKGYYIPGEEKYDRNSNSNEKYWGRV